ncbi:winged helix-turn-helix domain-containing protein [Kitasatospora sp. NBC_01287]|uniref:AfsR/SARP family transcriptional regulator n=1 Tax=Kitasatospora sp. NBC_01287 TaxID=2903573 RepID=UPI00224DDD0D|nr:BTAD domain-containing putative transcriptional regulator [Kitasatospora sp. NBC_01287]MCX4749447.1 winged helix-turn-helix domain-containing protein [Kitasatospora sp. NBC_01287]
MVPVHYGILGTTTAHDDDGTPVPLGGARLRALLAALVLRQGRPVPAEVLVAQVWDGELPQDSAAALQTLVGRLRRTIGRERVGSGPGGYWLTEGQSDLTRFHELAERGRRALAAGEPGLAAEQLREALALWRGPALADLPDRAGSAVRLEAQRSEAQRGRIAADLALGRAAEVTAELAGLCADHPLDEPLHVLWIRALHRCGRTAEALERYERLRRALAEQLGADPGAELRAVHQELLQDAPAPTGPAPAAPDGTPVPAPTVPAPAPTAAAATPPAAPSDGVPRGNLRPRLTSFVGREQDLAAVAELIGSARLVTLTGPGGSGKTRLSVEAGRAAQADARWPDGVWQAELAPLESPAAVPDAVLSALGLRGTVLHQSVTDARPEDPVRRIVEHCGRSRMMLLLDNCEHLIQPAAELADRLLAECPHLTILATSREPLGVPGEAVLPVEPLPDPIALRLLGERGAAARPGFSVADDPAAAAEICRRLDGLPLAIELAAARLRGLTPRQLADRLDGRFALLTGGSRVLLPRQQTLRAVVDWSWELLDERERAVLRRLAVFAGGATLEDAELVCADGGLVGSGEVAELLFSLVDKSLLVAGLDPQGPPRYWMLETIHEYGAERLAESGERAAVADRHLAAFRELVRTADQHLRGHRQTHWVRALEREQDNIRAALRHAADTGAEPDALMLLLGMVWFWMLRDYRAEARGWLDLVCALTTDPFAEGAPAPEPLELDVLRHPLPWPPVVLAEARRQAWVFQLVARFEGDLDVIGDAELIARAPRILAAYGPELPQSYFYPALLRIFACFLAGHADQMLALVDEAVEGCRRFGRESELAWSLQLRAKMSNDLVGGLEQARRDGDEAMEIYSRHGDSWGMAETLAAQAETAGYSGDIAAAVAAYRRAIELAQELGSPQDVPLLRIRLGEALLEEDQAEGERLIREGLVLAYSSGQRTDGALVYGHTVLSALHSLRGDYQAARAELHQLRQAKSGFGPGMPGIMSGLVSCSESLVLARSGELDEGVEQLRAGLRELRAVPMVALVFAQHVTLLMLPVVVGVLVIKAERDGDRALAWQAGLLYGAHGARQSSQGMFLERIDRGTRERALIGLLGEAGYQDACEQGRGYSWEETATLLDTLVDGL